MKNIVAVVSEDIGKTFQIFQELQRIADINFKMNIKENRILIDYDDGNNHREKFLIIDIDDHKKMNVSEFVGYNLITIGINNKASITISGLEEELIFCIQREIHTEYYVYEAQEIIIRNDFFKDKSMIDKILMFTVVLIVKGNDIDNIKELLNKTPVEYY